MRILFLLAFLANIALTLVSLAVLPSRMATHFGPDGMANGWAPTIVNAVLMTGVELLLFFSMYLSPRLLFLFPARWISLPNKAYWLDPANRTHTVEIMQDLMCRFGVALFLFLFVVGGLVLQANLNTPVRLRLPPFFTTLGIFLLYSVWWTVTFYRAFRRPAEA